MPRAKKQAPPRAKRGSIETAFILRMPSELRALAQRAAESDGVSESEWWRRAGAAALLVSADRSR